MAHADIKIPWVGWTIKKELGKGQFGKVYEIERQLLNSTEKAAMKVISIPRDEDALELMRLAYGYDDSAVAHSIVTQLTSVEREYSIMTKMRGHSNIVSCDDFSYVPHEGRPGYDVFIRMELLKSLQTVIREKRDNGQTFSEDEVLKIGADICRALKVCEVYNLIHRDIKPQNIMISPTGDYKLGDFGEARSMDHTTQASFAGTQSFMAPEVFKYEKYGKTVDIYSLGLVMHWLLNRYRRPFIPHDVPATPDLMAASENRRLSGEALEAPCDASPELSEVILKACAYMSKDRYRNADEMLNALEGIIAKNAKKVDDVSVVAEPSPKEENAVSASAHAQISELEDADTEPASAHAQISELEDAETEPAAAPAQISEFEDAETEPAAAPALISELEDAETISIPYPREVNNISGSAESVLSSAHNDRQSKTIISAVFARRLLPVILVFLVAGIALISTYLTYRHNYDFYFFLHPQELEELQEQLGVQPEQIEVNDSDIVVNYDLPLIDGIDSGRDLDDQSFEALYKDYTTSERISKMTAIRKKLAKIEDTSDESISTRYYYNDDLVFTIFYRFDGTFDLVDYR